MSSDDNLYRAPRSSLQTISQDGELTPAIVEYLSKAAFWARLQSVGYFLGIIAVPVALIIFAFGRVSEREVGMLFTIALIIGLPTMIMFWVLGIRMLRYAKAGKALSMSGSIEDAQQCFISSTSFFKISAILTILAFIFGILVGMLS